MSSRTRADSARRFFAPSPSTESGVPDGDLDFAGTEAPIPLGEKFAAAIDRHRHDRRLGFDGEQEAAALERQQPSVRAARAFWKNRDGNAAGHSLLRFL